MAIDDCDKLLDLAIKIAKQAHEGIVNVTHNLDISRISQPTAKDIERLRKYKTSLQRLNEALGNYF